MTRQHDHQKALHRSRIQLLEDQGAAHSAEAAAPSIAGGPASLLSLQRTVGNQTVQRLLKTFVARFTDDRGAEIRHTRDVEAPAPSAQANMVQRQVQLNQAVNTLSDIMASHELKAWYQANWPANVKRIAQEVADMAETTKENLRSKLQGHPEISVVLRPYRMDPTTHHDKELNLGSEELKTVYRAYMRLLFYHVTKAPGGVRAKGLDPSFGGKEGGISDERSLAGKRAENLAASKGKVFVTRKYSEAQQYAKEGGEILRVLIPLDQQATLEVDPDSQFGLFSKSLLKGMDRPNRELDWWAYSYLMYEIKDVNIKLALPALYQHLVNIGAFLPGKKEEELNLQAFDEKAKAEALSKIPADILADSLASK